MNALEGNWWIRWFIQFDIFLIILFVIFFPEIHRFRVIRFRRKTNYWELRKIELFTLIQLKNINIENIKCHAVNYRTNRNKSRIFISTDANFVCKSSHSMSFMLQHKPSFIIKFKHLFHITYSTSLSKYYFKHWISVFIKSKSLQKQQ